MKVGQEVDVKVDAYKKTLKGKVIKIGEASGGKICFDSQGHISRGIYQGCPEATCQDHGNK